MKYLKPLLLISLFTVACATTKKPLDTNTLIEAPVQSPPKTEKNVATPKKAEGNNNNKTVVCKVESDTRTITHVLGSNGTKLEDNRKCQITYKTFNSDDVVAYAHHQEEFCADVFDKVIKNLQNGGFVCLGETNK